MAVSPSNFAQSGAAALPALRGMLVLVLLGLIAFTLYRMLLPSQTNELASNIASPTTSNAVHKPQSDQAVLAHIVRAKMFGSPPVKRAPPPKRVERKPSKPPVSLTLWGLLVDESQAPLAIISKQGGIQKVVRQGQELEDQVLIREITPQGVHVDNRGQDVFLEMPKSEAGQMNRRGPNQHASPPGTPFGGGGMRERGASLHPGNHAPNGSRLSRTRLGY